MGHRNTVAVVRRGIRFDGDERNTQRDMDIPSVWDTRCRWCDVIIFDFILVEIRDPDFRSSDRVALDDGNSGVGVNECVGDNDEDPTKSLHSKDPRWTNDRDLCGVMTKPFTTRIGPLDEQRYR